ncbi:MAG: ATP-binding cassette domain-containing protein [Candidatus Dormibacteraeota bacterium]|nr:ATP-binding cassette domain-containing protein [Candidatus Dormibacteraeota bacterium]
MSQPAIELAAVTRRFKDFTAVDNLSFEVAAGEIFGVLGPNGSGKTTTVNMISGLLRPTAGEIRVLGHDITDARRIRARLGSVPQETALYEELSAEANLRFHADLFDVPRAQVEARVDAVLDLVQLADRRRSRVSTYSGGMKRRLALARALVHEPDLLYLDEPTLGVDVQSRRVLWDHILDLKAHGKTLLITTNYLEEANALCDRLAILDRGQLVAMDTPANLKRRFGDTVLELQLEPHAGSALLARLRQVAGVADVSQVNGTLKVSIEGERAVAGEIVSMVVGEGRLKGINQRDPSLDEVFLSLTGRELRD